MRRVIATLVTLSVVLVGGNAYASTADLKLLRITTNVASAKVGDRVVFKAYGKNLGPGESQLDITFSSLTHLADEAHGLREFCLIPAWEGGGTFDPDSPSCEFGPEPEGFVGIAKVVTYVMGTPGRYASIKFCTSNETGFADSNPTNDCRTGRVLITA